MKTVRNRSKRLLNEKKRVKKKCYEKKRNYEKRFAWY